jgi:hypothetical protein
LVDQGMMISNWILSSPNDSLPFMKDEFQEEEPEVKICEQKELRINLGETLMSKPSLPFDVFSTKTKEPKSAKGGSLFSPNSG